MAKTRLGQEEWKRVEEVYHEALEHRPESRAAFVTAACGGDSSLDRRAAKVIELRFFGGLTETEAAEALEISITTLKRDWDFARSWLATQLG
jgi:DNA-directed RNA polymerase specialized sigma24 family protein